MHHCSECGSNGMGPVMHQGSANVSMIFVPIKDNVALFSKVLYTDDRAFITEAIAIIYCDATVVYLPPLIVLHGAWLRA